MTKQQANSRIKKLRDEINHHRYLYHVKDTQEISDAALDSLKKELADLETQFPSLVTPASPTQRVGGQPLPQFQQVSHSTPMLSLQDAFTEEDLIQWEARNQKIVASDFDYFVSSKIDGVALALRYQNGQLTQGITRGNGRVGEDVTHAIRTIEAIPLHLSKKTTGTIEVRGEVYMLKKDFDRMNSQRLKAGQPSFANPRNVAAGSIRQLDPKLVAARPLRFYAWEISAGLSVKTRHEEYQQLQDLGFPVPPGATLETTISRVLTRLQKAEPKRERAPYLVDGAVIKINDLTQARRLGVVGKAPRGSIAFKYAAEEATTTVQDIVVQTGRTGALTPVAHLQPVSVAGTTVSHATLHNADEIRRKDVRIGDTVIIRKAGDIIPEVVKVLPKLRPKDSKAFTFPKKCPVCESPVHQDKDGVVVKCANKKCFSQQRARIIHALGKNGFDIEGLGTKIIEQLLGAGLIKDAPDVWQLTAADLTPLERFADTKANKLITKIKARKNITLGRFLVALGIPQVGAVTANDLAREFRTLPKLQAAKLEELEQVDGIGHKVAEEIVHFLRDKHTIDLISRYLAVGIIVSHTESQGPLNGQVFVFTGSLGDITRQEAKQLVQSHGGKVAATVGAKVDYVVIGEDAGSKAAKAKQLGLKMLTSSQFRQMLKKL